MSVVLIEDMVLGQSHGAPGGTLDQADFEAGMAPRERPQASFQPRNK